MIWWYFIQSSQGMIDFHQKVVAKELLFGPNDVIFWTTCFIYGIMPCPFTGRKMFCARPNFLSLFKNLFKYCATPLKMSFILSAFRVVLLQVAKCFVPVQFFLFQTKNLFTYCACHKHFVPDKKMICLQQNWFLCRHKSFWRGTKCSQIFGLNQKIWTGTKFFATCKRTRHL